MLDVDTGSERARLSSLQTFFFKFIFPVVWIGGFGAGTLALLLDRATGGPDGWSSLLVFIGGSAIVLYTTAPIKRVIATERGLLVSNYRTEVFLPYGQISAITENKFMSHRPITVSLRSPSRFGQKLVFQPYFAFVVFGDHPVATLLRERVAAARYGPPKS